MLVAQLWGQSHGMTSRFIVAPYAQESWVLVRKHPNFNYLLDLPKQ